MALINCPECNKQISDKTPSCPLCGYPISTYVQSGTQNAGPKNVQVIEATAKKWKAIQLIGVVFILIGFFSCVIMATDSPESMESFVFVPFLFFRWDRSIYNR